MMPLRCLLALLLTCTCLAGLAQRKEWALAKEQNSIPIVESFIDQNPGSKLLPEATAWRDSLYTRAFATEPTLELYEAYVARPHSAATEASVRNAHLDTFYQQSVAVGTASALSRFQRAFPGQMLDRMKEDGCRLRADRILGTAREDSLRAFAKSPECVGTMAMERVMRAIDSIDSVEVASALANDTMSAVFWFVMSHKDISRERFAQVDRHFESLLAKEPPLDASHLVAQVDSMIAPFKFEQDVAHMLDSSASNATTVVQPSRSLANTTGSTGKYSSRSTSFMTVSLDPLEQVRYDTDFRCADATGRFPKTCIESQWRNNRLNYLDVNSRMKTPNALTGDQGEGERQVRLLPFMRGDDMWALQLRIYTTEATEVYARFKGNWYRIQ